MKLRTRPPALSMNAARLVFTCLTVAPLAAPAAPAPPVARREPKESVLHGDRRVDDYAWMRDKANPQVLQHLQAENAYAEAMLRGTAPLQQALYKESLARTKQADQTVPYTEGSFRYYARTDKGKQYPIYCRQAADPGAKEQVILDLNALSQGAPYVGLLHEPFAVSEDGNLLAYAQDSTGFRQYTLHIKDLRTSQLGPEQVPRVTSLAWAQGDHLFYVVEDDSKRPYRLYHHAAGQAEDRLVYEEKDGRYNLSVSRTRSGAYLLAASESLTTSEVRFLPTKEPTGEWRVIAPRQKDHEYHVDHGLALPGHVSPTGPRKPTYGQKVTVGADLGEDLFFIRTNNGAQNFRLMIARPSDPGPKEWLEVLPGSDDSVLEDVLVFAGHFVVLERVDGLTKIRVTDRQTGAALRVGFPEQVYAIKAQDNHDFQSKSFRFLSEGLARQPVVLDYDMVKHEKRQLKQTEVPGGFDPARYETERQMAKAPDGTEVPVSIVYKKGLRRDGTAPLLLAGYGAYGFPFRIQFSVSLISLLDRGVVFAVAHVRGGGELGRKWYDGGRLLHKKNSFTDLIAVAEHLRAQKYAGPIVIEGRSAGGLLVTAAAQLRPELWRGVVAVVPFVDVINTMLDETLPDTVQEFDEWGNPKVQADYEYIKDYSPYDTLSPMEYPAMMVTGSLNDSQVMYWEPAKYVAKLRAVNTGKGPVLLRMNMAAGHGGPSGRFDLLREQSVINAWVLQQLGVRR